MLQKNHYKQKTMSHFLNNRNSSTGQQEHVFELTWLAAEYFNVSILHTFLKA